MAIVPVSLGFGTIISTKLSHLFKVQNGVGPSKYGGRVTSFSGKKLLTKRHSKLFCPLAICSPNLMNDKGCELNIDNYGSVYYFR